MRRKELLGVTIPALAVVAALAVAPYGVGARPASAAGRSQVITGGMFGVGTRYTKGAGDTWFNTWADDGNIYATSNDTSGFNGTCNSDLVVNELVGSDPTQLTAPYVNCMTSYGHAGDTSEYPDGCDWKSGGIISVSGVLYLAVARQTGVCTNAPDGEQPSMDASIVKSTDHGRTWSNGFGTTNDPNGAAPPLNKATGHVMAMFPRNHFSAPFFIQYGQDDNPASTADGGNKYVYAVSNDGFAYDGSYLYLGRVLRSKIGDLNAADWQFYTGPPGGNGLDSANWSSNFKDAKPILTSKNEISQPEIQYFPTLHRYVLISFYYPFSTHWPANGTASRSTFSFYEAPHPWGPWTQFLNKPTTLTVCYIDCQPQNTMPVGFYDPTLVSKFIRMEGLSNIIFTSGDFTDPSRYGDPQLYALHELPFTLSSTLYHITDDSSPQVTYKGSWTDSTFSSLGSDYFDGTVHYSDTPGNSVTYSFTGPTIEWIGSTNNNHGYAAVSIDGGPPTMVDTYSPDWVHQVTLFKRTGLTPGRHTITITVTSQHNPASAAPSTYQDIDAFVTATPTC
jgi:hypothetical protein